MGAAADPSLTVGGDGADDGLGHEVWAQNPALVPGSSTALPSAPVSTQGRPRLHTGWPPATPAQGTGCARGWLGTLQQQGPAGPRETGRDSVVLSRLPPGLTESRAAL